MSCPCVIFAFCLMQSTWLLFQWCYLFNNCSLLENTLKLFFFFYFRLPKFSTLPLFAPDCHLLVSLSERNQRFCLNVVLRISSVKTTSTHLYTQPPARSQSTDSMHSNSLPWCDKDICETLSKSVDAFILQSSTYGEFF